MTTRRRRDDPELYEEALYSNFIAAHSIGTIKDRKRDMGFYDVIALRSVLRLKQRLRLDEVTSVPEMAMDQIALALATRISRQNKKKRFVFCCCLLFLLLFSLFSRVDPISPHHLRLEAAMFVFSCRARLEHQTN
jgi:hypothetical protein